MIQSVDRALDLLWTVHREPELTLSELSAKSGLLASTALRLLATLEQHELLERDPLSRRYRIGPGVSVLAGVGNPDHERLRDALEPKLRELASAAKEQVMIGVLDGLSHLNIAVVDGASAAGHDVVLRSDDAHRQHNLNGTAIGKILLAYLPAASADDLIKRMSFERTARRTITDPDTLRRHLAAVRRNGYASSLSENSDEVAGVVVPIRDADDTVVAALSINGPVTRLPRARLREVLPMLRESATDCSTALQLREDRVQPSDRP